MTSTHYNVLDTLKSNLDKLSNLDVDFLNNSQNSELLSSFNKTFDLTSQFIKDTTKEDKLLDEFLKNRKELSDVFNKKLQQINSLCQELEKKFDHEKKVNKEALQRLKKTENNFSGGDFQALISRQEMVDRLKQWRHSCDLETIEIKNLKCKIDIMEEKMNSARYSSGQNKEKNRLFYDILSSSLKLTILSIDENENANLAILSESDVGSDQTWHLLSSSKDSDVSTCDYLWNMVEKSLCSNISHSLPQEPNTPKVNSLRLSSR